MALTKLTTDLIDGSLGTDWQATPKTADFTAVAGEGYFVNTTSVAITVTLPSSPSAGEEVSIIDYGLNASTNNITITSSDNIEGATDDLVLSTDKVSKTLVYSDATKGWLVTSEAGAAAALPDLTVNYLVVAGGGGGGGSISWSGGGGGAGGYKAGTSFPLSVNTDYTVTVGAGGAGGSSVNGTNGGISVFNNITSTGGGGGGGSENSLSAGSNGGSGGGGLGEVDPAGTGIPGQGFDGGVGGDGQSAYTSGGGGGGASDVGQAASAQSATKGGGNGGAGIANAITGTSWFYAGGGGGGSNQSNSTIGGQPGNGGGGTGGSQHTRTATVGAVNTGGGGGGDMNPGKQGGSGVVILRYPDYYDITVGSGLTTGQLNTAVGSDEKYTTFTGGTGNITFGAA